MCCDDDWEIRQPQDFVRGVPDTQIAPWLRPEPPDSFIPVTTSQPMLVNPVVNAVTLTSIVIDAPWNMKIVSLTTTSLIYFKRFPSTPESINGSAINTRTLG
jgi:multisubunit Na+/H+ antiporter MnhC subunit